MQGFFDLEDLPSAQPETSKLISKLLRALGVQLPEDAGDAEVATAAFAKIEELRGGTENANPLLPRQGGGGAKTAQVRKSYNGALSLEGLYHQNIALRNKLAASPVTRELSAADADRLAASLARRMGAPPESKAGAAMSLDNYATKEDRAVDALLRRIMAPTQRGRGA
jgi:hypothetical protein